MSVVFSCSTARGTGIRFEFTEPEYDIDVPDDEFRLELPPETTIVTPSGELGQKSRLERNTRCQGTAYGASQVDGQCGYRSNTYSWVEVNSVSVFPSSR
jgi:hypothetical protein